MSNDYSSAVGSPPGTVDAMFLKPPLRRPGIVIGVLLVAAVGAPDLTAAPTAEPDDRPTVTAITWTEVVPSAGSVGPSGLEGSP